MLQEQTPGFTSVIQDVTASTIGCLLVTSRLADILQGMSRLLLHVGQVKW